MESLAVNVGNSPVIPDRSLPLSNLEESVAPKEDVLRLDSIDSVIGDHIISFLQEEFRHIDGSNKELTEDYKAELLRNPGNRHYYLSLEPGTVVEGGRYKGLAIVFLLDKDDGKLLDGSAYVDKCVTNSQHRQNGVMSDLLLAISIDHPYHFLRARSSNAGAIKTFNSNGLSLIATQIPCSEEQEAGENLSKFDCAFKKSTGETWFAFLSEPLRKTGYSAHLKYIENTPDSFLPKSE